jgi:CTP:molybdopterin cytidylyltransferase MocA
LLLAAGAGTRMGMPKALVYDEQGSWLLRGVSALDRGGCERVTVVLGARAASAVHLLEGMGVEIAVAMDWQQGVSASLRAGLNGMDPTADAALVHLVDLPDIGAEVIARVRGVARDRSTLARACFAGQPGHPVLLGRDHWPEIVSTGAGDEGARGYLANRDHDLIECGDLATGADVDFRDEEPDEGTPAV